MWSQRTPTGTSLSFDLCPWPAFRPTAAASRCLQKSPWQRPPFASLNPLLHLLDFLRPQHLHLNPRGGLFRYREGRAAFRHLAQKLGVPPQARIVMSGGEGAVTSRLQVGDAEVSILVQIGGRGPGISNRCPFRNQNDG